MAGKTTKAEIAIRVFIIPEQQSWDGKHVLRIEFGPQVWRNSEWTYPESYTGDGELYMYRMIVRCHSYADCPTYGVRGVCFGEPVFEGDMDLSRMEAAVKTLRFLEKRLNALRDEHGPSESVGAYIARFATAIGAKRVLLVNENAEVGCNGEKFRNSLAGDAVNNINRRVETWQESHFSVTEDRTAA